MVLVKRKIVQQIMENSLFSNFWKKQFVHGKIEKMFVQ